jgi:hypothetical protein
MHLFRLSMCNMATQIYLQVALNALELRSAERQIVLQSVELRVQIHAACRFMLPNSFMRSNGHSLS